MLVDLREPLKKIVRGNMTPFVRRSENVSVLPYNEPSVFISESGEITSTKWTVKKNNWGISYE